MSSTNRSKHLQRVSEVPGKGRARTGPINGARANAATASPRSDAENVSLIAPPALVNGAAPKNPAKKRQTSRVSMLRAAPHLHTDQRHSRDEGNRRGTYPSWKMKNPKYVYWNTMRRPKLRRVSKSQPEWDDVRLAYWSPDERPKHESEHI